MIVSSTEDGSFSVVDSEVPLAEMFGYATVLRSLTQGKGRFYNGIQQVLKGARHQYLKTLKKEYAEKAKGGK